MKNDKNKTEKYTGVNIVLTDDVYNSLLETFQERMYNAGVKKGSKKYLDLQAEFFCGALRAIDIIGNNKNSCITPYVFINIIRGEVLKKRVKEEKATI